MNRLKLDIPSVLLYLVLVILGIATIYSSTYNPALKGAIDFSGSALRQVIWLGVSIVLVTIILFTETSAFRLGGYAVYLVVAGLLIFVLLFGKTVAGSKSWFDFFGIRFQPAELAKYGTALALAKFLSVSNNMLRDYTNVLKAFAIVVVPMLLILLQNDTGSALVFLSFALVFYREGLPGFWLLIAVWFVLLFVLTLKFGAWPISVAALIIGCIVYFIWLPRRQWFWVLFTSVLISLAFNFSVVFAFNQFLQPHQQDRILVTIGEKQDYKKVGYNVRQSQIAIGSGRLTGKGYLKGTQTKLGHVPEQNTDFIFCTIGEEFGFLGSLGFILLYLVFLARLVYLAERQHAIFSRVFGYGVVSVLFFHFFINVGMTMKIVPVIGIPLPLISYGGSSLMGFTLMIFTFLRLDANREYEINRAREH